MVDHLLLKRVSADLHRSRHRPISTLPSFQRSFANCTRQ
ncbi:Polyketide synthase, docking [Corchorus olitorius]|uniref:Polyketide synthase, docking n=1 Tax=Corchorus olitorius TaxID=93759 RepID=A0A1R3HE06_9ROSI|nr:Polyketide synthase, docking [Corchorus olitorius]